MAPILEIFSDIQSVFNSPTSISHSIDDGRWQKVQVFDDESPGRRHSAAGVVYCGKWFLHGGVGPQSAEHDDMWEFDPTTYAWTKIEPVDGIVPPKRWGHTAVLYKDSIFIYGGFNSTGLLNDVWEYQLGLVLPSTPLLSEGNRWSKKNPAGAPPIPSHYHQATEHEGQMFVFGGFNGRKNLTTIHTYDFGSFT